MTEADDWTETDDRIETVDRIETDDWTSTRAAFESASGWFAASVEAVQCAGLPLDAPGLGEWTVRDLVGHTLRALLTIESYAVPGVVTESETTTAGYFAALRTTRADPAAVAERGREAGRALGDDPFAVVRETAARARAVIAAGEARTRVDSPAGPMMLVRYLPTRVFELVVHTADLRSAAGLEVDPPRTAAVEALRVAGLLLTALPPGAEAAALLALTGRSPLPPGFSVL